MRKNHALFLLLVIVIFTSSCDNNKPKTFETLTFGGLQWLILDKKDNNALILCEKILETRPYHKDRVPITWEKCSLREYLNKDFCSKTLSKAEQERILETQNTTLQNTWYGTDGGNDTVDKVFILSLDEVIKYFGDSGQYKKPMNYVKDIEFIPDRFSKSRIAQDTSGKEWWWWLRSPGKYQYDATGVGTTGYIVVIGDVVDYATGGVRPAMWVRLP